MFVAGLKFFRNGFWGVGVIGGDWLDCGKADCGGRVAEKGGRVC